MADLLLCSLGPFEFGVSTAAYQTWTRETLERWAPAERIGARPSLQHLGPGAETLQLSGVIHPHYRGGLRQLDRMRALQARGEALELVDGEGHVLGLWVIESVSETARAFLSGGAPREQRFELGLRRHPEDDEA